MSEEQHYPGERLSLKGEACTVRYLGPVTDKPGVWLGVEWDNRNRGKHNGTHEGVEYFDCRSTSPTAASFIRPTQSWDRPRSFLEALREKYMPDYREEEAEVVYFSSKQAEQIGFEKFHQRQAKLHGIKVIVLDHMRIRHHQSEASNESSIIHHLCAEITELDLSGNLFETLEEIMVLCGQLPKLRVLTLDGNRFSVEASQQATKLPNVKSLSLSQTLLKHSDINEVLSGSFPSVEALVLADNELSDTMGLELPTSVSILDLSNNKFVSLADLHYISHAKSLRTLLLKRNRIATMHAQVTTNVTLGVAELDLTYNAINKWPFFDEVNPHVFPNLRHLRVTGNPIYQGLVSAEGKPLTSEDGYMLTIARLPQLEYLNYSKITEKERLNAETYYLSQIAVEISNTSESERTQVIASHPRYADLCEEYGAPEIRKKANIDQVDPNSLAARLVDVTFNSASTTEPQTWIESIPKSFDMYSVLGLVGKRLGVQPLDLRLILETNDLDVLSQVTGHDEPQEWDSSDDETDGGTREWVKRELELVPGTRSLGTYIESNEARLRIEAIRVDS